MIDLAEYLGSRTENHRTETVEIFSGIQSEYETYDLVDEPTEVRRSRGKKKISDLASQENRLFNHIKPDKNWKSGQLHMPVPLGLRK